MIFFKGNYGNCSHPAFAHPGIKFKLTRLAISPIACQDRLICQSNTKLLAVVKNYCRPSDFEQFVVCN